MMYICGGCGTQNKHGSSYCIECGASVLISGGFETLPKILIPCAYPSCERKIPLGKIFCTTEHAIKDLYSTGDWSDERQFLSYIRNVIGED